MKRIISMITTILLLFVALTGCASFFSNATVTGFSGSQHGTVMKASFSSFNGDKGAYIPLKEGDKISIKYELTCEDGALTLSFEDKSGNVLFTNSETAGTEEITADIGQRYTLRLTGAKAKGRYDVSWSINP